MGIKTSFHINLKKLREERKISQKSAAADLGISQALLSHYEKGIRECKLDFLRRAAAYYFVSCDYILNNNSENKILKENSSPYIKGVLRRDSTDYNTYHAMYNNLLITKISKLFSSLAEKKFSSEAKIAGESLLAALKSVEAGITANSQR